MRILITGGSGYIGSPLVLELSKNHQVYNYDIKNGDDVLDKVKLGRVFKSFKPDVVYHLAAKRNVIDCENHHNGYDDINFQSVEYIHNLCKSLNIRFIFTSSIAAINPCNNYSLSKSKAEKCITDGLIFRLTNVVGCYNDSYFKPDYNSLTDNIINCLKRKDVTLNIYGNCIRNYIHVEDVVDILIRCMFSKERIITISSDVNMTTHQYIESFENYYNETINKNILDRNDYEPESLIESKIINHSYLNRIIDSYSNHVNNINKLKGDE